MKFILCLVSSLGGGPDTKLEYFSVGSELLPAKVVVDLMERNRALQELISSSHGPGERHSFFLDSYDVIKGIPKSSSLERIVIRNCGGYKGLKLKCREEVDHLRECAKQSADSFIKLVTERSIITTFNGYFED